MVDHFDLNPIQCFACFCQVKQSRKKPLQVKTPRALPTMEAHQVIRANALFLLSLSSAAEPSMLCHHPPRPLHSQLLPSLKEGVSDEPPNKMGCLYLQTLARYLLQKIHHSRRIVKWFKSLSLFSYPLDNTLKTLAPTQMITSFKMRCDIYAQHLFRRPTFQSHQMPAQMYLRSQRATWSQCPLGYTLFSIPLLL